MKQSENGGHDEDGRQQHKDRVGRAQGLACPTLRLPEAWVDRLAEGVTDDHRRASEGLARGHHQMLDDRAKGQCRHEGEAADDQDRADEQADE